MKIESINFIRVEDLPKNTKNTEFSGVVAEIAEQVKKAPVGSGVEIKLDQKKRWTSYGIKATLRDKFDLNCQIINNGEKMYILRKSGQPSKSAAKK